jgi:NAD(P)-dependent dehydrogenase (short-subunit alcohol dehydrogenase family)
MVDLTGKTSIVTGSGRGIGRKTALALAKAGSNVVICDLNSDNIETVVQEINAIGSYGWGVVCDVTSESHVSNLFDKTISIFEKVDILVNNAGWQYVASIEESNLEDWERTMAVNLRGTFLTCRAAIPLMKQQENGVIINITSRAGRVPKAKAAAYGASKFGLNGFTLCLSLEVKEYGIRVIALAPPRTNTPLAQEIMAQFDSNADLTSWPDGSQFGSTVAFLASDEASQIDGVILETGGLRP